MRIGIFDPYLDDLGGGEKYMMTIAECLSKKYDVYVMWDNSDDLNAIKNRFSLNLENVTLTKNIFSSRTSMSSRMLESKKYDVLIVLSDGSIPVVLSKKLFLHIQQPLAQSDVITWKGKLKLKRVNKIFYNSEFSKTYNKKLLGDTNSQIIYPPVELFPEDTPKENIILHVGRFRVANVSTQDYKKQQVMVGAFKEMVDNGLTNWKFIIATSIHDTADTRFQEMITSAQGYPIEFAVNKTNKALWALYNKAKIYWHASGFGEDLEKNPHFAEHFGISTVEAMGAGVVPVAINAGGQKEIITEGENGLLWSTLEELQLKTQNLMKDTSLWRTLSRNARDRAKDFTKQKFCEALHRLVTESK